MNSYKYIIVGGGMTGDSAVKGIREVDPQGSIALIGAEEFPPYTRPLLSKKLWTGQKTLEDVWRGTASQGADLILSHRITAIDPDKKTLTDDQGETYQYGKLLLATGGTPRQLPFGEGLIRYFRTLEDYQALRAQAEQGASFAVIGGGFIGSEVAAALAMQGQPVTIIFPGDGIGSNIYPPKLVAFIDDYYKQKGVDVWSGESVTDVRAKGQQVEIVTQSGKSLVVDHVVAGIGLLPDTQLAEAAGLRVDNGILVGEDLQTSAADIYAAGDVANFENQALGGRVRVEHEDNSNTMGQAAGRAMAGQPEPYTHIPYFYSDMFELGYEAVGRLSSKFEIVEDWKEEPYKKGVVYYLDDGKVRGVLLWNVWDQVDAARDLLRSVGPKKPEDLIGAI